MSSSQQLQQRIPLNTMCFSIVIVRHPHSSKQLAVKETRNRGWWLPAGFLNQGETFESAALRHSSEEAGIDIVLKGVIRIEHSLFGLNNARMRVIFYAEPSDINAILKNIPDNISECACWMTIDELVNIGNDKHGLRGPELLNWAYQIQSGNPIYPLSILSREEDSIPTFSAFCIPLSKPDIKVLFSAVENSDLQTVKKCLMYDIDINLRINDKHWTCLHYAVRMNNVELSSILLLAGSDPTLLTHKNRNCFHFAAQANQTILMKCIMACDNATNYLNVSDINGDVPLHFTASCWSRDKNNVNMRNNYKLLTSQGAIPTIKNKSDWSAIETLLATGIKL